MNTGEQREGTNWPTILMVAALCTLGLLAGSRRGQTVVSSMGRGATFDQKKINPSIEKDRRPVNKIN